MPNPYKLIFLGTTVTIRCATIKFLQASLFYLGGKGIDLDEYLYSLKFPYFKLVQSKKTNPITKMMKI